MNRLSRLCKCLHSDTVFVFYVYLKEQESREADWLHNIDHIQDRLQVVVQYVELRPVTCDL